MKPTRPTKIVTLMTRSQVALNIFVLSLALNVPAADAAVKTTGVSKTDLAAINTDMIDSPVEVEATITSISPPREGSRAPYRFELADTTGSMTLVIWTNLYETIKAQSLLSTGDVVHVNGTVTMYRDNLQLQIHDAGDVKVVTKAAGGAPATEPNPASTPPSPVAKAKPAAPEPTTTSATPPTQPGAPGTTPVANITAAMVSKDVTVVATITEIREPRSERAPYTVILTQDDGHIPLVYWSDMQPQIKDKIKVGNRVRINAQVSDYKGTLQLKIRSAADVTVVTGS